MTLPLLFFYLASLVVLWFFPRVPKSLGLVCLSIAFFVLLGKGDNLLIYIALILLNFIVLYVIYRFFKPSKRFIAFFPLLYSAFLIYIAARRVPGWSYIVLIATVHIQSALLTQEGFDLRAWVKKHIFAVISFPKISMGPIDIGQVDAQIDWERSYYRFLLGALKIGILQQLLRIYVTKPDFKWAASDLPNMFLAGLWHYANLYLEFSGVIDIVIAIFILWGFQIKDNFRSPYFAISVTDFWRRWHISLGDWIKTNIYIPLGGSRKGIFVQVFNLMLTMALCGLWHGPTKAFILWGLLQGLGLSLEKIMSHFNMGYDRLPKPATWIITQVFIVFSWVVFFSGV